MNLPLTRDASIVSVFNVAFVYNNAYAPRTVLLNKVAAARMSDNASKIAVFAI